MSTDEELDREAESIYNAGSSWLSCLTELGQEQGIEAMDRLLTEGDPYPITTALNWMAGQMFIRLARIYGREAVAESLRTQLSSALTVSTAVVLVDSEDV